MEPSPPPPVRPTGRFRLSGFADAWRGLQVLVRTQPNARVHLLATVMTGAMGAWLGLAPLEWAVIVAVMALVWVSEALNTALEFALDLISPDWNRLAGWAKDAAAGAVLVAAAAAVIVGLLILGPKLGARLGIF